MAEDKNCNAMQKPWYNIPEAAVRWCNITNRTITLDSAGLPVPDPQNPCLRARAEHILDAVINFDLRHGRDGKTVPNDDHVARHRLTIRHSDLKEWMSDAFPDQKPAFLFDEIERNTHSSINADSFQALQADRDALQRQLHALKTDLEKKEYEKYEFAAQLKQCEERLKLSNDKIHPRTETTYINIIGALLECVTGSFKDINFANESQLRDFIAEKFDDFSGVSTRTLADKFALAKRALDGGQL